MTHGGLLGAPASWIEVSPRRMLSTRAALRFALQRWMFSGSSSAIGIHLLGMLKACLLGGLNDKGGRIGRPFERSQAWAQSTVTGREVF